MQNKNTPTIASPTEGNLKRRCFWKYGFYKINYENSISYNLSFNLERTAEFPSGRNFSQVSLTLRTFCIIFILIPYLYNRWLYGSIFLFSLYKKGSNAKFEYKILSL